MHFKVYAPDKIEYAIKRYAFETQRHFGILDARLAKQKYMLGDTYTIVDTSDLVSVPVQCSGSAALSTA